MTWYELTRLAATPFLPVVYSATRRNLVALVRSGAPGRARAAILDVGGRSSPYTIGLAADVTVLDLPREAELQEALQLGLDQRLLERLQGRRSNVVGVVLEDMTRCTLASESFDGVVAVEAIEHVVDDAAFVEQIERVVKPGGWAFLTTPNGDYISHDPGSNPDHQRHYTRDGLAELLGRCFPEVRVVYAVHTGRRRVRGLRSISPRRPLEALGTMAANVINGLESRHVEEQSRRTAHLFAVARKPAARKPVARKPVARKPVVRRS